MCVCVYSLLDILDLHAGCAAAAGAHEGLRPQLRDLCTPCLNTQTSTNISELGYFLCKFCSRRLLTSNRFK